MAPKKRRGGFSGSDGPDRKRTCVLSVNQNLPLVTEVPEPGDYKDNAKQNSEFRKKLETLEKNYVGSELEKLQGKMKEMKVKKKEKQMSDETREAAFLEWGREHVTRCYKDVGRIAYAIPPCFFKADTLEKVNNIEALKSKLPDSDRRGDKAERLVYQAFTTLNNTLEKEEKPTMFIIGDQLYENMLIWLQKAPAVLGLRHIDRTCHDVDMSRGKGKEFISNSEYFKVPEDSNVKRGEMDLMILHEQKGVIFIQVKSVDGSSDDDNQSKKTKKKIQDAIEQLHKDEKIFNCIMMVKKKKTIQKYVAVPFLGKEKIKDMKLDTGERIDFLCQDVFDNTRDVLRKWWDKLPNEGFPNGILMKDVIAKYIGAFSRPVKFDKSSDRSRVRDLADYIHWTACRFKRLVITHEQEKLLKEKLRHVYISGPPCSGKTMMLILKAIMHLNNTDGDIIILKVTRPDASARLLSQFIHQEIINKTNFKSRVRLMEANASDWNFDFTKTIMKPKSKIMFIMDKCHPAKYCKQLIKKLIRDFTNSSVWCAGTVGNKPECTDLKEVKLEVVLRTPPNLQSVLRLVDSSHKQYYKTDSDCKEIPTNGPFPLSIRHQGHAKSDILDCSSCARDLIRLLFDWLQFPCENNSDYTPLKPCHVVILFSIPETSFRTDRDNANKYLPKREHKEYMEKVQQCMFVSQIREELHPIKARVSVITDTEDQNLETQNDREVTCAWVERFKGLEREVVVFVPGESGQSAKHSSSSKSPTKHLTSQASRSPQNVHISQEPQPSTSTTSSECTKLGLANSYWTQSDVTRYSEWDMKSLITAASSSVSQLILVVPSASN